MGQDAKRGKLFTKYIREITVAALQAGNDLNANPRLRTAVDKALAANMTRDTIDRAIKRGAGGQEGQDLEEIRYEGYGPGGVAIMVDCLTNNRKRTVSDVRHLFTKYGGNLGTDGSVAYLFHQKGQIIFAPGADEEQILALALEAGAEDIKTESDGSVEVITFFENFSKVKEALATLEKKPESAQVTMIPMTVAVLNDKELAEKFMKFIDLLEDLDDVQAVYSNADIAEDILNKNEL
jgi:YebC/PmpR family DNA-binding regulatory protein